MDNIIPERFIKQVEGCSEMLQLLDHTLNSLRNYGFKIHEGQPAQDGKDNVISIQIQLPDFI